MKKRVLSLVFCLSFYICGVAWADEKPEIFVQLGHSEPIVSVAFSPDGRFALSGSEDETLKLWDVKTGKEIRTFRGHTGSVTNVAFSSDGRFALSWTFGNSSFCTYFNLKNEFAAAGLTWNSAMSEKVWDIASGKESSKDNVSFVDVSRFRRLSHDGKFDLFTFPSSEATRNNLKEGDIGLIDIGNNKLIRTFRGHKKYVNAMRFSPDEKYVLSASSDKTLKLWDIATEKEIRTFIGHTGWVKCLSFSPDGQSIVSGGSDGDIKLWDLHTGKGIRTFTGSQQVYSVAFSPDGKKILSGGYANTLQMWDIATGKEIITFKGEVAKDRIAIFSPDGKFVLSGGIGVPLKLWDVATAGKVRTYEGSQPPAAFSPDGKSIMSLTKDFYNLKLWDINTGKEIRTFKGHGGWVHSVAFSPDGKYALSGWGKNLQLLNITTGEEIKTFIGHTNDITSVAFSPDGKYALSSGGYDGLLKLWDINTGNEIRTFKGHRGPVHSVTFSPDGRFVLSGGDVGSYSGEAKLWDISTGTEIRTFTGHTSYVFSVAISPDGKSVLTGSLDHTLKLWDISTGKEIRTFRGHSSAIASVSFSPDGRLALSGSDDGTKRIWDITTGEEVVKIVDFNDGEWVVITPEGYFNASPNGAEHLNVRVGNNIYSIDNFYEKFFNPVYVASVLQGKKVEALADIRKGFALPPEVKIISPELNASFSTDTISITVSAKDTGGGIDEIRLYHNGKAIGEDVRAVKIVPKGNEVIKTYMVTLIDGLNAFRAVGFSKDRTESSPCELIVKLTAPPKDVSLYIIAVGINRYKNPALSLNYAEPDARGIIEFFRQKGKGLFKKVEVLDIYNEQATKETIISKLKHLQNTQPQDAVLIYLAGHGENINDKWYFIPHELTYPEREKDVKTKGISSDELAGYIKSIKAQKILMLIDACKSGAVLVAFRGFEDRKALSQLSRSTGMHIIAASTKDQFAAEVKELGHGVFTHTLLEGLRGKASGGGETVTVRKLMGYIEEQLPDITKKYKQEAQYPVVDSRGMDFPLAIAK